MAYSKEEMREYMRLWRKANPDKVKEYYKKYWSQPKYKEMQKAATKRWVQKNRDRVNAKRRERYRKEEMMEAQL